MAQVVGVKRIVVIKEGDVLTLSRIEPGVCGCGPVERQAALIDHAQGKSTPPVLA
ncbi:MAG: hypothetical protein WA134_05180 [Rhodoferax sp.]